MKKLPTFVSGMLTMALIGGLGISALAASGQVAFNVSALSLNGTQVSAKGENYTLANGHSVPASITYTDETGGGTTYLPVRRISELLGVETGWDGVAGAVTVGAIPETTTPPNDYSTWTAEEETAYQEFKGLWEVEYKGLETSLGQKRDSYYAYPKDPANNAMKKWEEFSQSVQDKYSYRWMTELRADCGVILTLCKENGAGASYGFSIAEGGQFWPGHT